MKFIKTHGPHGPHHPPRHHRHHGFSESILRMVLDLADHGVPPEDLHKAIDQELRTKVAKEQRSRIEELDPGCGTPEEPINPFTRAAALELEIRRLGDQTARELSKQHVVVAGEFPPHILDYLLDRPGSRITQFHPPGPHSQLPPHFRHLAPHGLVGVTSVHKLAEIEAQILLFEAFEDGSTLLVSPYVPLALRIFRDARVLVMASEDCAPHMTESIDDMGFERLTGIFD